MRRLLGVILAATTGASCATDWRPIPQSSLRVTAPVQAKGTELELKVFTTESECLGTVRPDEVQRCLPHVDRALGEVSLAFQLKLDGEDFPLPLEEKHLQVTHLGTVVSDGVGGQEVTLIPHDPVRAPQLFVVLIDGSSSMSEPAHGDRTRMDEVRAALLSDEVATAFFPPGIKTGVLVLQFTEGTPVRLGDVLETRDAYEQTVRDQLQVRSGYTHLYDAVGYAVGPLLDEPDVKRMIDLYQATPSVLVLTDGFNDESAGDTCRDNAPRLERLLGAIDDVRADGQGDLRARPTITTVGLGRPLRPNVVLPEPSPHVRAADLCGTRYPDSRIDGDLERLGIDNTSLALIAQHGGGFSYVRQDRKGLGDAFASAGAERFYWFELRYRLDPFFLRRKFRTGLRLNSFAEAEASVVFAPSAWLDPPPAERGTDGWAMPQTLRATLLTVLPVLGGLIVLGFAAPAWFNVQRALFSRVKR